MDSQNDQINRRNFVRFGALATVMAGAFATQIVQAEEKEQVITTDALIAASQINQETVYLIQDFAKSLDKSAALDFFETFASSFNESNNLVDAAIITIASYDQLNKAYVLEIKLSFPEYQETWLNKETSAKALPWNKIWKTVVLISKTIIELDKIWR